MHLPRLPAQPHLTYCTNIHAGESWPDIRDSLREFVPPIRDALTQGAPMGIGLRLSGQAADTLVQPEHLQAFQAQLRELNAYVFTVNAFPYGRFHGTQVKQDVYQPDWRHPERLRYTQVCADILAALLPEGVNGSISTVPVGFRDAADTEQALSDILSHLLQTVAHLVRLHQQTGQHIALALEPEPACFLETTQEAADFMLQKVRQPGPVARSEEHTSELQSH